MRAVPSSDCQPARAIGLYIITSIVDITRTRQRGTGRRLPRWRVLMLRMVSSSDAEGVLYRSPGSRYSAHPEAPETEDRRIPKGYHPPFRMRPSQGRQRRRYRAPGVALRSYAATLTLIAGLRYSTASRAVSCLGPRRRSALPADRSCTGANSPKNTHRAAEGGPSRGGGILSPQPQASPGHRRNK